MSMRDNWEKKFSPMPIDLWWQDCSTGRRVDQSERRPYKPRNSASSSSSDVPTESEEETLKFR